MSRDETVKIEGLRQLVKDLRAADAGLDDLKRANQAASNIVLEEARSSGPQRTGALMRSGRVNKAVGKANVLFGNARVVYGPVQHWGWPSRHIKAQPWVTTAAARTQPQWLTAYEDELQTIMKSIE